MNKFKSLVAGLALTGVAGSASALGNFDTDIFNDANAVAQAKFDALSEDFGAALSYKAITPAEPLGLIGFDVGLEISGTQLEGVDEWGEALDTDIGLLPLPKLHIHKGLPFGIDLGAVYSQVPTTDIQYMGGEIRYSFISGNIAIPAIAVRGTYTQVIGIDELDFSTMGAELTVSKGFLMATPYAGIGQVWVNSKLDYSYEQSGVQVPVKLEASDDLSLFKYFIGLNFNLGLMNIVAEMDQTGDAITYSGKLGFRF